MPQEEALISINSLQSDAENSFVDFLDWVNISYLIHSLSLENEVPYLVLTNK